MIVIESAGRFGNQIFQYAAAIASSRRKEKIFLVGFHQFSNYFGHSVVSKIRHLSYRKFGLLLRLPRTLWGLPVMGEILLDSERRSFVRKRGILPVFIFRAGYCQDERLVFGEAIRDMFQSRTTLNTALNDYLTHNGAKPRCFVHIRRGDYLSYPAESPAAIPLSWFLDQVVRIRQTLTSVEFLFFSDDPDWVEEKLPNDRDFQFFHGSAEESFTAMAQCQAGILSASSFSWWAAYLAVSTGAPGPFLAPRHWLGWRGGSWYPRNVESQFLSYVRVVDLEP